jgi:hypothetical protein
MPAFWNYDVDENNEFIVPEPNIFDDRGCKLYTYDALKKLSTQEKTLTFSSYIKEYDLINRQSKNYIMTYIYYLLYTTRFKLNNKKFYDIAISKLYEFAKNNIIIYKQRIIFKEILYLFTGVYICEFKECTRTSCDKQHKYCNIHIRRINKDSKTLSNLTKLPLDISKMVYDYIV